MVQVYTYDDPRRWKNHSQFDRIKKAIHFGATKSIVDGIKNAYQNPKEKEFQYIFTIREVIDGLLSRWISPEKQLKQYLKLSKVINRHPMNNKDLKNAFLRNRYDILETIHFLAIAGVEPKDMNVIENNDYQLKGKERFFRDIWNELENIDYSFAMMRNRIKKGWTKEEVKQKLDGILKGQKKEPLDYDIDTIVLHGFYFITPEQQVILHALKETGFEIIFFNYYDVDFSGTFDFIRAFITKHFGWSDDWHIESVKEKKYNSLGSIFLAAYENKIVKSFETNKPIIRYDSFQQFLNEVIVRHYEIDEYEPDLDDVQIIATNADILNDVLVQYYPDRYADKRNFLQYPIGQFISNLHKMINQGELILNDDILISAFSSGWLYHPKLGKNARDYTYLLKKLLPYFNGCHSVEHDWKPRFKKLINIYDEILPLFEKENDDGIIKRIRNPLTKLSYLSLSKNELEEIYYFVNQLIYIAEKLFVVGADGTSFTDHFEKLASIIEEINPMNHSDLLPIEREIITSLQNKLKSIKDDEVFFYDDVGEAINVYLSGKLSNEDYSIIKPFIEVDGIAFNPNLKKVYLTGLDERGLPLDEFSLPWPLQEETFEKLSVKYEVLELHTLRNISVNQISRYLLFIALEFLSDKKMELSWMVDFLDRKDLQPSVYIHQLGLTVKDFNRKEKRTSNHLGRRDNGVDHFEEEESGAVREHLEVLMFNDFLAEFNHCARRYYYSYIMDEHPVYDDDFSHQFLYTYLFRLVKRNTSLGDSDAIRIVGQLFPQWTDYKKTLIAKTYNKRIGKREWMENINGTTRISATRKEFQFAGWNWSKRIELFDQTEKNKVKLKTKLEKNLETASIFDAKPGFNCRFCPHLDVCEEGRYAIDEK